MWEGSTCKVCRSLRTGEMHDVDMFNMHCQACHIAHNLWVCMVCGHIGCGRYSSEHAKGHYASTHHTFSLELATGRIWDYESDLYAHRVLRGADGRPSNIPHPHDFGEELQVGLPSVLGRKGLELDGADDVKGFNKEGLTAGEVERRKMRSVAREYDLLVALQLEEQQRYFEEQMAKMIAEVAEQRANEEAFTEEERAEVAVMKESIGDLERRLEELMGQLREEQESVRVVMARNQELSRRQQGCKQQVAEARSEAKRLKGQCDSQVAELEQQVSDLSFYLKAQSQVETGSKKELQGGQVVMQGQGQAQAAGEEKGKAHGSGSGVRGRLQRKLAEKAQKRMSR
ncbi:unnamed protein product [Chrysoparadoxa australica]